MTLFGYGNRVQDGFEFMCYLSNVAGRYIYANSIYDSIKRAIDPSNYQNGKWHHIVYIRNAVDSLVVYYDGVPFSSTGTYMSNGQTDTYLILGSWGNFTGSEYEGCLADVRVYDGALTEDSVKQIYDWGKNNLEK